MLWPKGCMEYSQMGSNKHIKNIVLILIFMDNQVLNCCERCKAFVLEQYPLELLIITWLRNRPACAWYLNIIEMQLYVHI